MFCHLKTEGAYNAVLLIAISVCWRQQQFLLFSPQTDILEMRAPSPLPVLKAAYIKAKEKFTENMDYKLFLDNWHSIAHMEAHFDSFWWTRTLQTDTEDSCVNQPETQTLRKSFLQVQHQKRK